jgi:hypothetical protein
MTAASRPSPFAALALLTLLLTNLAWAQGASCQQHTAIRNFLDSHRADSVDLLFPDYEWLGQQREQQDLNLLSLNVAKTVVLALIGRTNWVTFAIIPNRAEAATMTGHFINSPDNFAKFLRLPTRQACLYLRMNDSSAVQLRRLVRTLYARVLRAGG